MGGVVSLAEGKLNAVLSLVSQIVQLGMVIHLRPFNDLFSEFIGEFTSICNMLSYIVIAFPVLSGWQPAWMGDMTKVILAVMGTCIAATKALQGPLTFVISFVHKKFKGIECRSLCGNLSSACCFGAASAGQAAVRGNAVAATGAATSTTVALIIAVFIVYSSAVSMQLLYCMSCSVSATAATMTPLTM